MKSEAKIYLVCGTRPNFVKLAAVAKALRRYKAPGTVHSPRCASLRSAGTVPFANNALVDRAFFDDLDIPRPDFNPGAGSGSHARQTALPAYSARQEGSGDSPLRSLLCRVGGQTPFRRTADV